MEAVPAQPAATFQERCCAAAAAAAAEGRAPDVIYLSQCTYLTQQTLVPNVTAMVRGLRAAVAGGGAGAAPAAGAGAAGSTGLTSGGPLIIVDGYHGFMALPTDLGEVAGQCCYVAGLLKHAGDEGRLLGS